VLLASEGGNNLSELLRHGQGCPPLTKCLSQIILGPIIKGVPQPTGAVEPRTTQGAQLVPPLHQLRRVRGTGRQRL